MVCDLMIESVERRFGCVARLPQAVWNGSATIAVATPPEKTLSFLRIWDSSAVLLGQKPQIQWHDRSFRRTFNRDYVCIHDRPDAETCETQLAYWFEDHNEHHPHKGLTMKSPR